MFRLFNTGKDDNQIYKFVIINKWEFIQLNPFFVTSFLTKMYISTPDLLKKEVILSKVCENRHLVTQNNEIIKK